MSLRAAVSGWRVAVVVVVAGVGLTGRAPGAELAWRFQDGNDVVSTLNFPYANARDGNFRGLTRWDPYVYLQLPASGFDAAALHYLEVRLYSSAPADVLDVYYKAANGDWGLMCKFPVERGWATYRMDMNSISAHECAGSPQARSWGGADKRIVSLRLDPGNEGDRWVLVSHVRLTDQALEEGVIEEPLGTMDPPTIQVPREAEAGARLKITATFRPRETPDGMTAALGFLRLTRGQGVLGEVVQKLDPRRPEVVLTGEFPTSRHLSAGAITVSAGVYELDEVPQAPLGRPLASIDLRNPLQGTRRPPQVDVRRIAGDPTLHVDGEPLVGMTFLVGDGQRLQEHKEFADAGIHIYSDWFGTSGDGDLGHPAEDRYDYGGFDAYFADLLDADPEALFLPHLYVTPPVWWQKQNPQEMCVYSDGTLGYQSFGSDKWRTEMGDDLRRLLAHLQSSTYADRILGYILCSGHSAEWQEWGIWDGKWADYSEPSRRAFRNWLQARYGTDAGLQAAWRDPAVRLDTAQLPTVERRTSATAGVLRDPTKEQSVVDFYQYLSETVASDILYFARIVKAATDRRSLAGAYYGYLTQHGIHQQDSAHLALAKVLESPDIDFLMSPPMYTGRELGGTSTFMTAAASVRLQGKLWINESDIRTHLTDPSSGYGRVDTLAQSRAVLLREFGEMLARRTATSWFDMSGGWFSDPTLLSDLAAMHKEAGRAIERRKPFRAEMAVFISAESACRMKPSAHWMPAVLDQVVSLPRVGVPADVYLLSDLNRPDFPEYRICVFLNACYVDAATRQAIDTKLKRRGTTTVWIFASGAVTDDGLSTSSMQSLTGIKLVAEFDQAAPLQVKLADDSLVGWPETNGPIVWADDPAAASLGTLTCNGKPGLVRRTVDGWTSIYLATVGMPPALLRELARAAGAHVYLETNDALDTDGQYACIHAQTPGPKTLRLPQPARVRDVMSGRVLAEQSATITLEMAAGETVLLEIE